MPESSDVDFRVVMLVVRGHEDEVPRALTAEEEKEVARRMHARGAAAATIAARLSLKTKDVAAFLAMGSATDG